MTFKSNIISVYISIAQKFVFLVPNMGGEFMQRLLSEYVHHSLPTLGENNIC